MDENRKIYMCICYLLVAIIVSLLGWVLFTEYNVSNQRERDNDVRDELANTGAAQRDAEKHLDSAGQRIDRSIESVDEIAGRIDEATERIESVQERSESVARIIEDSERRISESRAIIQSIRERARQS